MSKFESMLYNTAAEKTKEKSTLCVLLLWSIGDSNP